MKKVTYVTLMTCVAAGLLGACSDELVPNGGTHNSELVGFTMDCSGDSVKSRSMDSKKPFCGVLAMTSEDNSGDSLYLHTNVMDNPVVVSTDSKKKAVSRGTPVNEANFGDNFYVYAYTNVDNTTRTYMQNIKVTKGSTAWLPESNFYWTENDLDFFAYHGDDQSKISSLNHNIVYSSNAEDMKKQASFSYTVPKSNDNTTDATVQPDIMMSFNSCGKSDYAGVAPLKFSHALSAVKFELDVPITGKIKTVTIEGIYGTGTCVYDGAKVLSTKDDTSDDYVWTTSGSTVSYTQSFDQAIDKADVEGDKTIKLDGDKEQFTFMLIPQTIPSTAKVKVVMWDSENNVEHTFAGTISDGTAKWLPGKTYTYIISRNAVVWEYIFEVTPTVDFKLVDATTGNYSVTSYKRTASVGQTIELPWKVAEFADIPQSVNSSGEAWDDGTAVKSTTLPASGWLSSFVTSGNGNVAVNEVSIRPQNIISSYLGDREMQTDREKYPIRGSEDEPWDLSIHRHGSTPKNVLTRARCTANCYIVHSPGTYMIPLVYGNAIYNGVANPSAYTYQTTGKEDTSLPQVLNKFVDANDQEITQPYVQGADNAIMLWQDAYNLVKKNSVKLCTTPDGIKALQFTLNPEFMQEANIVFAARQGDKILWSWHVWVHEHGYNVYYKVKNHVANPVLGNAKTFTAEDNKDLIDGCFPIATGNLGHCMAKKLEIPAKKAVVTFTQYDLDGSETEAPNRIDNVMTTTVTLEGLNFEQSLGNNVYYQFGRKDPLVGVQNNGNAVKKHYVDDSKYEYNGITAETKRLAKSIGDAIQNPTVFFADWEAANYRCDDWINVTGGYMNLWNNYDYLHTQEPWKRTTDPAVYTEYDEYAEKIYNDNIRVIKTVYDPCPVGFKLPPAGAFRSITKFGRGTYRPISVEDRANQGVVPIDVVIATTGTTDNDESVRNSNQFIWNRLAWKNNVLRTTYYASTDPEYLNYKQNNKFRGGYKAFTNTGDDYIASTNRYYIKTEGASFSTGGSTTELSIEPTGQRSYKPDVGTPVGVANMGPNNVYLWTADVVTNANTTSRGNLAVALYLSKKDPVKDILYQESEDEPGSSFHTDAAYSIAKAMARPIRPMYDNDFDKVPNLR